MKAMSRMSPPQAGHASGKSSAILQRDVHSAVGACGTTAVTVLRAMSRANVASSRV